mmetsp:Transcript_38724/g.111927  ORF Transcript_38724/g.111927 Transcript_38724/m.111927 type:complete len:206 (-) Transcript_38724:686-1303(-)
MRKWRLMSASSVPLRFTTFGCARTRRMRFTESGRALESARRCSSAARRRSGPKSSCSQGKRFLPRIWPIWCTNTVAVISASKPASCEASAAKSGSSPGGGAAATSAGARVALGSATESAASSQGSRYSWSGREFTSKDTGRGPPGVPCDCAAAWAMKSQSALSVAGGCKPTKSSWASAKYFVSNVCGNNCNHEDLNSCILSGRSP